MKRRGYDRFRDLEDARDSCRMCMFWSPNVELAATGTVHVPMANTTGQCRKIRPNSESNFAVTAPDVWCDDFKVAMILVRGVMRAYGAARKAILRLEAQVTAHEQANFVLNEKLREIARLRRKGRRK